MGMPTAFMTKWQMNCIHITTRTSEQVGGPAVPSQDEFPVA